MMKKTLLLGLCLLVVVLLVPAGSQAQPGKADLRTTIETGINNNLNNILISKYEIEVSGFSDTRINVVITAAPQGIKNELAAQVVGHFIIVIKL